MASWMTRWKERRHEVLNANPLATLEQMKTDFGSITSKQAPCEYQYHRVYFRWDAVYVQADGRHPPNNEMNSVC